MNIEKALALKNGDIVRCPADRGAPGFTGKAVHAYKEKCRTKDGVDYVWVLVFDPAKHRSAVWPSNRLG